MLKGIMPLQEIETKLEHYDDHVDYGKVLVSILYYQQKQKEQNDRTNYKKITRE